MKVAGKASALVASDPVLKQMLGSIYDGHISEAQASGVTPRNLIHLGLHGGLAPWYFHCPMNPSDGDESLFVPSNQVATRIKDITTDSNNNPLYNLEYKSVPITKNGKTINMPHMFSLNMPHRNGGVRPISDICENMLMIRGVKMDDDGHVGNRRRMFGPIPGEQSITGIGADFSKTNIPCMSIGDVTYYKSKKGTGLVNIDDRENNYMDKLMKPFEASSSNSFRNNVSIRDQIYAALDVIKSNNASDNSLFKGLLDSRKKAEAVIVAGVSDFIQQYLAAEAKYLDLIERSVRETNLPGITDRPIPGCQFPITVDGDVDFRGHKNEENYKYATCQFTWYLKPLCGEDLRKDYDECTTWYLHKKFAMIEVLVKNNLCSTISVWCDALRSVRTTLGEGLSKNYDSSTDKTTFSISSAEPRSNSGMNFDNHGGGYLYTLLSHTLYCRALASCIAELQDQLKSVTYDNGKNAYNESLIVLMSEMGRRPEDDGTQHYGNGNAVAMWGGVLSFDCLGDVYNTSYGSYKDQSPWSYGTGKEMVSNDQNLNGRRILNANVASTICSICRYPTSPAINNNSLVIVNEENESSTYSIPTGKTYAWS